MRTAAVCRRSLDLPDIRDYAFNVKKVRGQHVSIVHRDTRHLPDAM
jgi:hypothetical protein